MMAFFGLLYCAQGLYEQTEVSVIQESLIELKIDALTALPVKVLRVSSHPSTGWPLCSEHMTSLEIEETIKDICLD
jgi:hypothetical protein